MLSLPRIRRKGHKSYNCPKHRDVKFCDHCFEENHSADGENEANYEEEQGPDEDNYLSCVVHRLCLAPKSVNLEQRHNLFGTRRAVQGKIVDIIIDNGTIDNLVSTKVVSAVPLSIVKHYVDNVLCDAVPNFQ